MKIIPIKIQLIFILSFALIVPIGGYLFFSFIILLILQVFTPIWCFCLGEITSLIILILTLCSKDQYGIVFKENKLLYCDYTVNKIPDEWELPYTEISNIKYKKKGGVFNPRKELTSKNVIILIINQYRFKCIDLSLYSKYQSRKILKALKIKVFQSKKLQNNK